MTEASHARGRNLLKATNPVTLNPPVRSVIRGPGTPGPGAARRVWKEHKWDPALAHVHDPEELPRCRRAEKAAGHSPGDAPGASGVRTEGGVRPAQAAR